MKKTKVKLQVKKIFVAPTQSNEFDAAENSSKW